MWGRYIYQLWSRKLPPETFPTCPALFILCKMPGGLWETQSQPVNQTTVKYALQKISLNHFGGKYILSTPFVEGCISPSHPPLCAHLEIPHFEASCHFPTHHTHFWLMMRLHSQLVQLPWNSRRDRRWAERSSNVHLLRDIRRIHWPAFFSLSKQWHDAIFCRI